MSRVGIARLAESRSTTENWNHLISDGLQPLRERVRTCRPGCKAPRAAPTAARALTTWLKVHVCAKTTAAWPCCVKYVILDKSEVIIRRLQLRKSFKPDDRSRHNSDSSNRCSDSLLGRDSDYSKFLHSSSKHASIGCAGCHHRTDNSSRPTFRPQRLHRLPPDAVHHSEYPHVFHLSYKRERQ